MRESNRNEQESQRQRERENALATLLNSDYQDMSGIDDYNKRWPIPLTAGDVAEAARIREIPLADRVGSAEIRRQVQEDFGYQPR